MVGNVQEPSVCEDIKGDEGRLRGKDGMGIRGLWSSISVVLASCARKKYA